MAVKSKLPLNSPQVLKSLNRDEGGSDTASEESKRKCRDNSDATRKKKKQPQNQSKIFDGLKTLYS
jgi:hypothetical protein